MVFLILWCSMCRKLYEWSASMKQHDGVILTNYSAVTLPWEYHQEICNLLENHVGSSPSVVKHLPGNYCIICHYLFLSKHKLGYFLLRGCAICHVWRHLLLYILESIQWWCKHQTKVTTWKFWKFLAKYKLFYKSGSLSGGQGSATHTGAIHGCWSSNELLWLDLKTSFPDSSQSIDHRGDMHYS